MKFLVIIEGVPPTVLPPEQMLPLTKEMWAWSRRLVEAGKADVHYALADHAGGLNGGFGIMNVKSLEELAENLGTFPGVGLVTMKVYPLVAVEVAEKLIEGAQAQLAKKKK
jgi:muconolactone delta-isomerase